MKSTALSVQNSLTSALHGYQDSAAAVKDHHHSTRQAIKDDPRRSDTAKKDDLAALAKETRAKLDALKANQESYVKGLRDKVELELRGNQPGDANSVLLRRDASSRVRKLADKKEAMEMLEDAIRNGDAEMAHAVGNRARNTGMFDVAEAYQAAYPDTAESAAALSYIEANTSDSAAYNVSNSITFSSPVD